MPGQHKFTVASTRQPPGHQRLQAPIGILDRCRRRILQTQSGTGRKRSDYQSDWIHPYPIANCNGSYTVTPMVARQVQQILPTMMSGCQ